MEIKLVVRAEIIAAIRLFAADNKDIRKQLNGINLEIGALESRLVATNGHILGCFRVESEQPEVETPLTDIIIPIELFKPVKAKGFVEITIGAAEQAASFSRPVTVGYKGMLMSGRTLDWKFPDWRRLVPSRCTGEMAQFDPRYIILLAKAFVALHPNKRFPSVGIGHNGGSAALVALADENFFGLLMPTTSTFAPQVPPEWWADSLRKTVDSAPQQASADALALV